MYNETIFTLIERGGYVIAILAVCSIISVKVIIEKFVAFAGIREKIINDLKQKTLNSIENQDLSETTFLLKTISWKSFMMRIKSPLAVVLRYIVDNTKENNEELTENSFLQLDKEIAKLEKGLGVLATLGSVSPFIGLFGTVLGIISSFNALAINNAGNYTQVMSGISDALIATAAGLFVAVPAVMFYNYFMKRLKLSMPLFDEAIKDTIKKVKSLKQD
jgi:biopolymer transport protein ExbB/TolQ